MPSHIAYKFKYISGCVQHNDVEYLFENKDGIKIIRITNEWIHGNGLTLRLLNSILICTKLKINLVMKLNLNLINLILPKLFRLRLI